MLLTLAGWFLIRKLQYAPDFHKFGLGWLLAWGLQLTLAALCRCDAPCMATVACAHHWPGLSIREHATVDGGWRIRAAPQHGEPDTHGSDQAPGSDALLKATTASWYWWAWAGRRLPSSSYRLSSSNC